MANWFWDHSKDLSPVCTSALEKEFAVQHGRNNGLSLFLMSNSSLGILPAEIVVPIFSQNGEVTGVLDIDSKELATFDDIDQQYLERICKMLTSLNL